MSDKAQYNGKKKSVVSLSTLNFCSIYDANNSGAVLLKVSWLQWWLDDTIPDFQV